MINCVNRGRNLHNFVSSLAYIILWFIWKAHNGVVLRNERRAVMVIADDIYVNTFNWIKLRSKFYNLDWSVWSMSPNSNLCFTNDTITR